MTLAALFGDDEHTATEDAYTRSLKARKWVVLASVVFFGVHAPLFEPVAFSVGVGRVIIPLHGWSVASGTGLIYIVTQYALLNVQLVLRYRDLLGQRFGLRELERAAILQHTIRSLLADREEALTANMPPMMTHSSGPSDDIALARIDKRLEEIQKELDALPRRTRPGPIYTAAEAGIDFLRLASPWGAAIVALLSAKYGF